MSNLCEHNVVSLHAVAVIRTSRRWRDAFTPSCRRYEGTVAKVEFCTGWCVNLLLVAGRRVALNPHIVVARRRVDAAVGPAHRLRSTSVEAAAALGRVAAASIAAAAAPVLLGRGRAVATSVTSSSIALLGRRGSVPTTSVALGRAVLLLGRVPAAAAVLRLLVAALRSAILRLLPVLLLRASGRRAAGRRLPGIRAIAALGRVAAWWRGHSVKRCVRGARAAGARARAGAGDGVASPLVTGAAARARSAPRFFGA